MTRQEDWETSKDVSARLESYSSPIDAEPILFRISIPMTNDQPIKFECRAKEPDGVTICSDVIRPEHMGTHAAAQHQSLVYTVNASIGKPSVVKGMSND